VGGGWRGGGLAVGDTNLNNNLGSPPPGAGNIVVELCDRGNLKQVFIRLPHCSPPAQGTPVHSPSLSHAARRRPVTADNVVTRGGSE
jgi:hypothetical protein